MPTLPASTDFHGIQADALAAALRCLEADGKAKCVRAVLYFAPRRSPISLFRVFTGAAGDDPGVKFFTSR